MRKRKGVGSSLVQLGKLFGCKVVGVVGASHKVDTAKRMGCDVVIGNFGNGFPSFSFFFFEPKKDKSKQKLWLEVEKLYPEGVDVVFDANGVETLKESYKHLTSGGKVM